MEPSIERFNSTNYNTWKEDVRVLLMDRNSCRIITSQEVKPNDGASAKEKLNFESRWDQAYSTIYLSIEEEYRNLISDTCDPIVAWKKLQDHFQPHTRARVIGLLDEFFNCRILEEEEIGLYATLLRTIVFQLRDAGQPLEDLYQAFQLIEYLPESYQGIVQSIYRWDNNDFKFEHILSELLTEESRLKQCKKDLNLIDTNDLAHKTKNMKLKSGNFKKSENKIGPCFNCHKMGHLIENYDYSRKVTVFPIKRKSDVFNCFTRYQKWAERFLNNKVVNVRIDNGLEFIHKEFCTFLDSQVTEMERTNTYSPEMNGKADWESYASSVDSEINRNPLTNDVESDWLTLKDIIIRNAEMTIPRGNFRKTKKHFIHESESLQKLLWRRKNIYLGHLVYLLNLQLEPSYRN
ncbi:copia protein [Trichonephila clavipes]|uniref:Copia protein n=1 Tax=Trichonephila clavipes TaxID=2585209 RepID=A0A8X6RK04_TRICX|nr:copia protein [Trichonephila clavipes]